MADKKLCIWYNETSGMKRAFDKGLLDKKWVENYCWIRISTYWQENYLLHFIRPSAVAQA
jgi:hypothetical protein